MKYHLSKVHVTAACCLTILLAGLSGQACADAGNTALLVRVIPDDGGTLNISTGLHMYDRDAEVTLKAAPRPGYQFVCWQGAVSEAASSSTLVFLDTPKIVIAVFERSKFDLMEMAEEEAQPSVGGGGLHPSAGDISAPLEQAIGGRRPHQWHWPRPDDFELPVPDDEGQGDLGVPPGGDVPEPSTITFIITGMFLLTKYRNRRNSLK